MSGNTPDATAPQAGDGAQPQAGTANIPEQPQAGDSDDLSPAQLKAMLADARKEAAKHRTDLRRFQQADEQRKNAELTEAQRLAKQVEELTGQIGTYQRRERDYALRDAIAEAVADERFGHQLVASPQRVIRLLDAEAVQWDGDRPTNVRGLLARMIETDGYLFQPKPRRPGSGDGGAGGDRRPAADMNHLLRQAVGRQ